MFAQQINFAIDDVLHSSYHCHNKNIAINYMVIVLVIAHNEIYAFDLSLSYLCLHIIQTLPSILLNYTLELVYIKTNNVIAIVSTTP